MTFPQSTPTVVGAQPRTADEVNQKIGAHLSQFLTLKTIIGQDRDYLATATLTAEPYFFTPDQETLIKTAINGLDSAFDAIDMTFINRLIGLG